MSSEKLGSSDRETVRANTGEKGDNLPAGRKEVQSRLLQVIEHQPACVGEKAIRPIMMMG